MGWTFTLSAGAGLLALLLLSARLQARRGIDRIHSLVPWDYVMILSAILLILLLAHGAILWRDGWPLPWETGGPPV
jgi:hypothetical protein